MPENLINHSELVTEIQCFVDMIRRKTGKLEPEQKVSFVEASYVDRKPYDHKFICDIIANTDPDQPYNINLWDFVSPIWYSKEEYTFNQETGIYIRSGVSAEPDFLETVPPYLHEWKTRLATSLDLGRVVGILEYLEKDTPNQIEVDESFKAESKSGSKLANWVLGRK